VSIFVQNVNVKNVNHKNFEDILGIFFENPYQVEENFGIPTPQIENTPISLSQGMTHFC